MSVVAIYNMKGGVGKTTTAVNLAYLAAAEGHRALLWDLDPQAASSFALRIRPRVAKLGKKSLKNGDAFVDAIKETDYSNLDVLPADFAYRKLDRLLGRLDKPERVVATLLETLGDNYDMVFLDCPAGFSLLTEGIFAASDAVLVPTIPTVLSLRMVARLVKWADRSQSRAELAPFFSMVDRRKALHRRAAEWRPSDPDVFLDGQVPYASAVEQMAVRRLPLPVFAPRDPATAAFAGIWTELRGRLGQHPSAPRPHERWDALLRDLESLIVRLEITDLDPRKSLRDTAPPAPGEDRRQSCAGEPRVGPQTGATGSFVHTFDTDAGDLRRCGFVLELRERPGNLLVVAAQLGPPDDAETDCRAEAQIDSTWALKILSGAMSPLTALECRLGAPVPVLDHVRGAAAGRAFRRVDSRLAN
jgi:cellulose biosynthesis protein BcsQ